ncbi:unnamed protein product [Boreogadus saida]
MSIVCFSPLDTVNPTKCGCPFALKMAACQLLLEITTFLRETFPCLPRPRAEPLVTAAGIAPLMRADGATVGPRAGVACTCSFSPGWVESVARVRGGGFESAAGDESRVAVGESAASGGSRGVAVRGRTWVCKAGESGARVCGVSVRRGWLSPVLGPRLAGPVLAPRVRRRVRIRLL